MFRLLQQPYPQSESAQRNTVAAALTGVFVFCFLWFFQPFGIGNWDTPHKTWYLAGYGWVTAVVVAFDLVVLKRVFSRFFAETHWTVGKAIGWTLFILLSVGAGNHLYAILVGISAFHWNDFAGTLLSTFAVGVFPSVLIPLSNYVYQLRKYSAPATVAQNPVSPPTRLPAAESPETIELVAENGKDKLSVALADLLYIESSDNYSTVFWANPPTQRTSADLSATADGVAARAGNEKSANSGNGKIAKELVRSSLSRLEMQIAVPNVVRCHRSYIVNLAKVRSVSGNAQGYKLHLDGLETPVPVARKYSQIVKKQPPPTPSEGGGFWLPSPSEGGRG